MSSQEGKKDDQSDCDEENAHTPATTEADVVPSTIAPSRPDNDKNTDRSKELSLDEDGVWLKEKEKSMISVAPPFRQEAAGTDAPAESQLQLDNEKMEMSINSVGQADAHVDIELKPSKLSALSDASEDASTTTDPEPVPYAPSLRRTQHIARRVAPGAVSVAGVNAGFGPDFSPTAAQSSFRSSTSSREGLAIVHAELVLATSFRHTELERLQNDNQAMVRELETLRSGNESGSATPVQAVAISGEEGHVVDEILDADNSDTDSETSKRVTLCCPLYLLCGCLVGGAVVLAVILWGVSNRNEVGNVVQGVGIAAESISPTPQPSLLFSTIASIIPSTSPVIVSSATPSYTVAPTPTDFTSEPSSQPSTSPVPSYIPSNVHSISPSAWLKPASERLTIAPSRLRQTLAPTSGLVTNGSNPTESPASPTSTPGGLQATFSPSRTALRATNGPTGEPTVRPTIHPTEQPVQNPTRPPTLPPSPPPSSNEKACFGTRLELLDAVGVYTSSPSPTSFVSLKYGWPIDSWCVGNIRDFRDIFDSQSEFNENIANWDLSFASDTSNMFRYATAFNQDISGWRMSNVRDMSNMFYSASSFNNNLSTWDVSVVTSMTGMFALSAFNRDISSWDVSTLTDASSMFSIAAKFDQDLCPWGSKLDASVDTQNMFTFSGCESQNDPIVTGSLVSPICKIC